MFRIFIFAAALLCASCGSYKAVRPDAPTVVVAETQSYTVHYQDADARKIQAVYINSNSPMTVELRQGSTVETLKQVASSGNALEYANLRTRWRVQEGFATLIRKNTPIVFTEIIE